MCGASGCGIDGAIRDVMRCATMRCKQASRKQAGINASERGRNVQTTRDIHACRARTRTTKRQEKNKRKKEQRKRVTHRKRIHTIQCARDPTHADARDAKRNETQPTNAADAQTNEREGIFFLTGTRRTGSCTHERCESQTKATSRLPAITSAVPLL
jgi:hypothetical protein